MSQLPKSLLVFTFIALSSSFAETVTEAQATEKSNVLFIAIDDLNDWIGALNGHPQVRTPNIDALAARGVLFKNAYCAASACMPSRTAVLSGLSPANSGALGNHANFKKRFPDHQTILTHFREDGYWVAGGGKIHHDRKKFYDEWEAEYDVWRDPTNWTAPSDEEKDGLEESKFFFWGPYDTDDLDAMDGVTAQWIVEQLNEKKDEQPLFLACGFRKPHLPWYAPRKYFEKYPLETLEIPHYLENDLDDVPETGKRFAHLDYEQPSVHRRMVERGKWKKAIQAYLATISHIDALIGYLMEELEKSGQAENTYVVLWGDHGWHLGDKEHWKKFTCWERGAHVPLIIAGPGIEPGVVDAPVSLLDIYPTLIELCQLPEHPQGIDGHSLVPLLENPATEWPYPAISFYDNYFDYAETVRTKRWRYIRYADGTEELYDHSVDSDEFNNLADDPQYAELKVELAAYIPQTEATAETRTSTKKRRLENAKEKADGKGEAEG